MNDNTMNDNTGNTDLRGILDETVTRLFADRVTRHVLESAEAGEWPADLWTALEENGLTQPLVPEDKGGVGAGWADAYVILRAAGHYAAPVPLAETILGGWLLLRAGLDVPAGPLTVAPVRAGDALRIAPDGNGWRLSGTASGVPWGGDAAHVAVLAEHDGTTMAALVASGEYAVAPDRNIAREPRDGLTFDGAPVLAAASVNEGARQALRLHGALARSGQMAGALTRVLGEAVQYAGDRVQFGRPIGKFQAIQQNLAVLAAQTAGAGMAAETAFRAADRAAAAGGAAELEIAGAKVVVGEAVTSAASIAHQVHGAIGFTYEHALHFATRRLWSWRAEFGAESHWAALLGRAAIRRGADRLWPDLTARQAGQGGHGRA